MYMSCSLVLELDHTLFGLCCFVLPRYIHSSPSHRNNQEYSQIKQPPGIRIVVLAEGSLSAARLDKQSQRKSGELRPLQLSI